MQTLADFQVGDCLVRPSLNEIVKGARRIHVEPKSIDVLVALARKGRELSLKRELIETVWGESYVSDEVLTHAIWELRKALGDNASSPTYIQTIPKRGYRLLVSITWEELAAGGSTPEETARLRWPWAAATLAILAAVFWIGGTQRPAPSAPERGFGLDVVGTSLDSRLSDPARQLAAAVGQRLVGKPGLSVVPEAKRCSSQPGRFCLLVGARNGANGPVADLQIESPDGAQVFSIRSIPDLGSEATVEDLREQVEAFFELISLPYHDDPDFTSWYDLSVHDVRAVLLFVSSSWYVYENEPGARVGFDRAIELDPDFIAPRVWRIGTLLREGEQDRAVEHLEELDRLWNDATPFQKAMILWADALVKNDVPLQLLHLGAAVGDDRNRPALCVLAETQAQMGYHEEAMSLFAELVEAKWRFGPVYSVAARTALQLHDLERTRWILDTALEVHPGRRLAPETLDILRTLAVFDENQTLESEYTRLLELRILTMTEEYEYDACEVATPLAEIAESESRPAVAERLRESCE